jgi:hypothetical protein
MQFSLSFYIHFVLSFVGFLFIGIYLCRGSWRNTFRNPVALGFGLVALGHVIGPHSTVNTIGYCALVGLFGWQFWRGFTNSNFIPSEMREGHNVFSLLAGAALFALMVQLHSVLFGVPVFQLVK